MVVIGATQGRGERIPQESQIARLAEAGTSNPDIAARLLFLSPRTIE